MENQDKDSVYFSQSKYILIQKILKNIHENIGKVIDILEQGPEEYTNGEDAFLQINETLKNAQKDLEALGTERVLEGVFNGEKMIAEDGTDFIVPANYASKSKIVEGDILKLTINKKGDFLYKQIGPVERKKIIGSLTQDKSGNYFVVSEKKKWKVLPASVTYFKGEPGDEVVILVPKDSKSKWAAVENIVKK